MSTQEGAQHRHFIEFHSFPISFNAQLAVGRAYREVFDGGNDFTLRVIGVFDIAEYLYTLFEVLLFDFNLDGHGELSCLVVEPVE